MSPVPLRQSGKVAWVGIGLALVAVTWAGMFFGPLLLEHNSYSGTTSIEQRSDYRDPQLMSNAWAMSVAARYRMHSFEFQKNPSFCGPASIANVANSVGIEMTQDQVVADTAYDTFFGVIFKGLTLVQAADLARLRLPGSVSVLRNLDLPAFRAQMARVNEPAIRIIVNFHRGPLFGRGHGHFSPLLAYLPDKDLVLVGDVNRNFQPFLVETQNLCVAANTIDRETGSSRGLIVVSVGAHPTVH